MPDEFDLLPDEFDLLPSDWDIIKQRIEVGNCTPFLGAGACSGTLPLGSEIAKDWASDPKYNYPLSDGHDLARVAQFLAVTRDPVFPKTEISKIFKKKLLDEGKQPDFNSPNEPHFFLAGLDLPVYITTNYDDFMERALRMKGKNPKTEICLWNKHIVQEYRNSNKKSIFETDEGFEPTVQEPVVFHLHGHFLEDKSLVVSEGDYLDFLVNIAKDNEHKKLLPPRIQRAMTGSSLIFLGYKLADWDLRVLLRTLYSNLDLSMRHKGISVQLEPEDHEIMPGAKKAAKEYIKYYFSESYNIKMFWGPCDKFVEELKKKMEE